MMWPLLPRSVYSALGPVPVTEGECPDDAQGVCSFTQRTIVLEPGQHPASTFATLFHEQIHFALWDAGVDGLLTNTQREAVCDAVSLYLAGAVKAGYLILGDPNE